MFLPPPIPPPEPPPPKPSAPPNPAPEPAEPPTVTDAVPAAETDLSAAEWNRPKTKPPRLPIDWTRVQYNLLRHGLGLLAVGMSIWAGLGGWQRYVHNPELVIAGWYGLLLLALIFCIYAPHSHMLTVRAMAGGGAFLLPFVIIFMKYFEPETPLFPITLATMVLIAGALRFLQLEAHYLGMRRRPDGTMLPPFQSPAWSPRRIVWQRVVAAGALPALASNFLYLVLGWTWNPPGRQALPRMSLVAAAAMIVILYCARAKNLTARLLLYGLTLAVCLLGIIAKTYALMVYLWLWPGGATTPDGIQAVLMVAGVMLLLAACASMAVWNLPADLALLLPAESLPAGDEEEILPPADWDEQKASRNDA